MENQSIHQLPLSTGLTSYFIGPDISTGPLPAIIYFALSAEQSLNEDPYNQAVKDFYGLPVRVFSFTLPYHGESYQNAQAIGAWANEYANQIDMIGNYIQQLEDSINELISQNLIEENKIAFIGLSRGGLIAAHLTARIKYARYLLGFAPLVSLSTVIEFKELSHLKMVQMLDLNNICNYLVDKDVRFYIGNRDERVMTDVCYAFIHNLTDVNYHKGYRSPPVELILSPSIGYKGHGTSPHVFANGSQWLLEKLQL